MKVNELFESEHDQDLYLTIGLTAEELTIIRLALRDYKHYCEDAFTIFKESHGNLNHYRKQLEKVNVLLETLKTN